MLSVFFKWITVVIEPYEALLKLVSYLIGPGFAIFSFWRNKQFVADLAEKAEALGSLRKEAEGARAEIKERTEQALALREEADRRTSQVAKLENDLRLFAEGESDLWNLRPALNVERYQNWLRAPKGAKVITIGNLKGGVGKTTLAANFGAYISQTLCKPVLLIDLDFQGSLSNMLLLANDMEEVESHVDLLFAEDAGLATVDRASIQLFRKLTQAWLVPSNYPFAQMENKLLLQWMLQKDGGVDVRYRLAHTLLRPEVRERYAAIIFDMPPRMSLGSVNALVASHHFVIPTIPDTLSSEAVGQFIRNVKAIKKDLGLDIELAGIAGMMTRVETPGATELKALASAREAGEAWSDGVDYVYKTTIPRRVAIANAAGQDIAYLNPDIRPLFDPLFEEMRQAIWKGGGP